MKYLIILLGVVCLALPTCAPAPEPEPEAAPEPVFDQAAEEAAIRSMFPGNAYNEHDAAAIADRYLEDGQLISSTGITVGKAAIEENYEGIFKRNPEIKSAVALDSVRFLTPDVAIALMRGTVTGQAEPSQWKFLATLVLVKQSGEWKAALAQFIGDETE